MKSAPLNENELERLQELLDLQVLDTPPEPAFDEITALAKELCQTPIALVTLVDRTRQWFKSRQGVEVLEIARDLSFCAYTIGTPDVFVVSNALEDPRFADNPIVIGPPHVIFYAGVPLFTSRGHALGTLCVIDHVPRKLSPMQLKGLQILARNVMRLFELKAQNIEIRRLIESMEAKELQVVETARMASLGEMAGGMAHQINNPLSIILARAEAAARDLKSGSHNLHAAQMKVDSIIENCERIAKIVDDLLKFSRLRVSVDPVPLDAQDLIGTLVSMSRERLLSQGIELRIVCEEKYIFKGIEPQVLQCLHRLISNSVEAIQSRDEKWIEIQVSASDDRVRFEVTDSGPGISDPEILNKMMLPFFTTKESRRGTGLGLSTTKSQIEEMSGRFYFDSGSKHTRFVIELPRVFEEARFSPRSA